jgi:glycerol-3-phosphate dehydrogenase
MAKEAVRKTVKWLREHDSEFDAAGRERSGTKHRPLPGAEGLDEPSLEGVAAIGRALIDEQGLDGETATHLCGVYGVRARVLGEAIAADPTLGQRLDPELPYVWAEIDFAARHDRARTVDDVLSRRVPLLLVGREQGLDVADQVAARIAAIHGWSAEEIARQLAGYKKTVADSRRFRT